MTLTLALAGDTMLGRGVADRLLANPRTPLLDPALIEVARSADLFLLNLECCVSDRGTQIDEPGKPFFFRAPPVAAERLAEIGVSCVTLANNHALDFGPEALADTLAHLAASGIVTVGAGASEPDARAPVRLSAGRERLKVVALADDPASYAAGSDRPGIAFADLRCLGVPEWVRYACGRAADELVLVMVHWGPNMTPAPVPYVRVAAETIEAAGATLVVGHSAHVPQGVRGRVLFDLGDFLDDYRVDRRLRNDLSMLWLVTLDERGPQRIEGLPVRLEYAHTRPADSGEARQLLRLLDERCAATGSRADLVGGRVVFVDFDDLSR